jgi:hypothetical protein
MGKTVAERSEDLKAHTKQQFSAESFKNALKPAALRAYYAEFIGMVRVLSRPIAVLGPCEIFHKRWTACTRFNINNWPPINSAGDLSVRQRRLGCLLFQSRLNLFGDFPPGMLPSHWRMR